MASPRNPSTMKTPSAVDGMQTFKWEGVNRNGVKIKGETQAANANWLRATLRRQGINPGRIVKKPKPLFKPAIKPADIAHFARQMTTMMKSGVPMVQSLQMVGGGGDNIAMHDLIKKIIVPCHCYCGSRHCFFDYVNLGYSSI